MNFLFLTLAILINISSCTPESDNQLSLYQNTDYFVVGLNNIDNIFFFLQKKPGNHINEMIQNGIKGNLYLTESGMLIVLESGQVYKLNIDKNLATSKMFNKALYGSNYTIPNGIQVPRFSDTAANVELIHGIGAGIIYMEGSPNDVPEALECECRSATVHDADCISGGSGSESCSLSTGAGLEVLEVGGSGGTSCGITCNGSAYACCK